SVAQFSRDAPAERFLKRSAGASRLNWAIERIIMIESKYARPQIISPDTLRGSALDRTPPEQVLTSKWPVLHHGKVPSVDPNSPDWRLRIFGLVEAPYELTYAELRAMPAVDVVCDMHCVTHWSRLNNVFTGIPTRALIEKAKPRPEAR